MRPIGMQHPTDIGPFPPQAVATFIMTGTSSAQSAAWISSGSTATANASVAGIHIIRIIPVSTAGAKAQVFANLFTTAAAVPTSGTSASSVGGGVNFPVDEGRFYQVPGESTGYSIAAQSSCNVYVEMWARS